MQTKIEYKSILLLLRQIPRNPVKNSDSFRVMLPVLAFVNRKRNHKSNFDTGFATLTKLLYQFKFNMYLELTKQRFIVILW